MHIIVTIVIFIMVYLIFIITKPAFLYNHKKSEFRSFGLGGNNTLLTVPIFSGFISVILYLLTCYITEEEPIIIYNNGVTNGVTSGVINGITNGVTNGITNGVTNGVTNGGGITSNIINTLPIGFDLNSIIEAGIKAKLLESGGT